jgi:hypothetical protein
VNQNSESLSVRAVFWRSNLLLTDRLLRSLRSLAITILFCGIIFNICSAQLLQDKRQHSLLLQGIHYTLEQEYDSAETVFRTMIKEFPKHPSGYLYLAGMYQAKYTDYGDHFNQKQYDSLLNVTETLAEVMIEKDETKAWGYFYSGTADAFRSYTASEEGSLPTGFYYGLSAGNLLQRCLEVDSSFVAAKDILGAYYYWRSKLAWIPFISNRTEEGIRFIKETLQHPYEKHLASHNLVLILTDEKRFEESEKYGLEMLELYPNNRSFMWNLVRTYAYWNNTEKLYQMSQRLLNSTLHAPVVNRYIEAACRLKIAEHAFQEKQFEVTREECTKIIELKKYIGKVKGDIRSKVKKAEILMKDSNK